MWHDLLIAVALMMVVEGVLPFLSPHNLRKFMIQVAQTDDRTLRTIGLVSMVLGVLLLYSLH
jgi:uncharacterized protein YjeT (DUF2065 family)